MVSGLIALVLSEIVLVLSETVLVLSETVLVLSETLLVLESGTVYSIGAHTADPTDGSVSEGSVEYEYHVAEYEYEQMRELFRVELVDDLMHGADDALFDAWPPRVGQIALEEY